jgi:hypothetical protein
MLILIYTDPHMMFRILELVCTAMFQNRIFQCKYQYIFGLFEKALPPAALFREASYYYKIQQRKNRGILKIGFLILLKSYISDII